MLHNLLPQDCRASEIVSAASMLSMAVYMAMAGTNYSELLRIHPFQFWVILFTIFGGLQLVSLIFHEQLELPQYVLALVNGSIWVWLSAVVQDPIAFFVGISNLYAFSVGFLFLKKSWQNC